MDEALSGNRNEDKKIVRRFPMKFRSSGLWFCLIHPPHRPSITQWDGKYAQSCTIVLLHYKVFCYLQKRDLFWYRHSKCRTWHVNPVNKLRMFLLLKYYSPMNTHGKTVVCDFCVLWITPLSLFTRHKSCKRKFWHVYSIFIGVWYFVRMSTVGMKQLSLGQQFFHAPLSVCRFSFETLS